MLENKFNYDFYTAMSYLNKNYKFLLLDYKICRPNFITNDVYINNHQKAHQNYEVKYPKIIMKLKKKLSKPRGENHSIKNNQSQYMYKS